MPCPGFAQANVTLAWSPSTNPIVAGFNIYYGGASGVYTNKTSVGTATSLTISNLLNGNTYYFAATTYSAAGAESALSSEVSYTVPSNPVNQPPTLNPIGNLTINQNAGIQSVTLSGISAGAGNQGQTLTVSAKSSNTNLIANPAVTYTSPNATGSLAFAPAANTSGSATITVTVTDSGASNNIVSQSFIVTVNPVNQPPTLNPIGNLTINQNAGIQSVTLSGISAGAGNSGQTLTVTAKSSNTNLIANPAVTYTSPNASGSLAFTPAANTSGSATITVTVTDSGASNNTVSQSFIVTVNNDIILPTLSIISPTPNLQWSNATCTVAGWAADNVGIATVYYSLNDSPWTNADTANNWTNWSASLALNPGTNFIQAYAVDISGNSSPTNVVSFKYVVPMPLHVSFKIKGPKKFKSGAVVSFSSQTTSTTNTLATIGLGSVRVTSLGTTNPKWSLVNPDDNSTLLAVNENYVLTATPAPGFAFTYWSDANDNPLTNGPTLQFTMTTNLALVANFLDVTRPTHGVLFPTPNLQWSNAICTVAGWAADNVGIAAVYYSLNGAPWTNADTANNWTNWSASLDLVPGTNVFQNFAVDTSGNCSPTNTVRFEYVVPMPLSVQVFGLGTANPKWGSVRVTSLATTNPKWNLINPDDNSTLLAVNENYVLTATPAPGFAFTNWSDANDNPLTNSPTLQFTMTTNLALVANFLDVTRPTRGVLFPTPNLQWSNATCTVAGWAADNVGIAAVYYSLNGAPWTNADTANNWTNWSASLTLNPGTNVFQNFAVDTSGNCSPTNTVRFEYVVPIVTSAVSSSVQPIIAAPAQLTPASFSTSQFALTVLGTTNSQYIVQASTDMVNWISVQTNTAPFTYMDTNAAQFNQRFYRTVSVP